MQIQRCKKSISLLLAGVIFCQASVSAIAESNLWSDRRVASATISLPAHIQFPSTIRSLPSTPFWNGSKTHQRLPSHLKSLVNAIPTGFGTVEEISNSHSQQIVVLIQDVHLNPEAQLNSAKILQSLIDQKQIAAVGVEGAFSEFDFSSLRAFPNKEIARAVAEDVLRKNLIAAPSFVGITSVVEPPPFMGIDDAIAYEENVNAYRSSVASNSTLKNQLSGLKAQIEKRKKSIFSPALARFDSKQTQYYGGKLGLGDYLKAISMDVVDRDLIIDQFLTAYATESRLNFAEVDRQRKVVVEKLAGILNPREVSDLVTASVAYKSGELGFGDYYQNLKDLCELKGLSLRQWPAFDEYIRYVLLADGIKGDALFTSMEKLEKRILKRLVVTPEQKALVEASQHLRLTEKLIEFSLTPKEWQTYKSLMSGRQSPLLTPFEQFYKQADIRSDRMVANLLSENTEKGSAVVVGGFHSLEMKDQLKRRGISYVLVSPKITKVESAAGNAYLSIFARETMPLDRLFAGEKLSISAKFLTVGSDEPSAKPTEELMKAVIPFETRMHSDENVSSFIHIRLARRFVKLLHGAHEKFVPKKGELKVLHTRIIAESLRQRVGLSAMGILVAQYLARNHPYTSFTIFLCSFTWIFTAHPNRQFKPLRTTIGFLMGITLWVFLDSSYLFSGVLAVASTQDVVPDANAGEVSTNVPIVDFNRPGVHYNIPLKNLKPGQPDITLDFTTSISAPMLIQIKVAGKKIGDVNVLKVDQVLLIVGFFPIGERGQDSYFEFKGKGIAQTFLNWFSWEAHNGNLEIQTVTSTIPFIQLARRFFADWLKIGDIFEQIEELLSQYGLYGKQVQGTVQLFEVDVQQKTISKVPLALLQLEEGLYRIDDSSEDTPGLTKGQLIKTDAAGHVYIDKGEGYILTPFRIDSGSYVHTIGGVPRFIQVPQSPIPSAAEFEDAVLEVLKTDDIFTWTALLERFGPLTRWQRSKEELARTVRELGEAKRIRVEEGGDWKGFFNEVDETGAQTDRIVSYQAKESKGYLVAGSGLILISQSGRILIQKSKKMFDWSGGGHTEIGDTPEDTAINEATDELDLTKLGIKLKHEKLVRIPSPQGKKFWRTKWGFGFSKGQYTSDDSFEIPLNHVQSNALEYLFRHEITDDEMDRIVRHFAESGGNEEVKEVYALMPDEVAALESPIKLPGSIHWFFADPISFAHLKKWLVPSDSPQKPWLKFCIAMVGVVLTLWTGNLANLMLSAATIEYPNQSKVTKRNDLRVPVFITLTKWAKRSVVNAVDAIPNYSRVGMIKKLMSGIRDQNIKAIQMLVNALPRFEKAGVYDVSQSLFSRKGGQAVQGELLRRMFRELIRQNQSQKTLNFYVCGIGYQALELMSLIAIFHEELHSLQETADDWKVRFVVIDTHEQVIDQSALLFSYLRKRYENSGPFSRVTSNDIKKDSLTDLHLEAFAKFRYKREGESFEAVAARTLNSLNDANAKFPSISFHQAHTMNLRSLRRARRDAELLAGEKVPAHMIIERNVSYTTSHILDYALIVKRNFMHRWIECFFNMKNLVSAFAEKGTFYVQEPSEFLGRFGRQRIQPSVPKMRGLDVVTLKEMAADLVPAKGNESDAANLGTGVYRISDPASVSKTTFRDFLIGTFTGEKIPSDVSRYIRLTKIGGTLAAILLACWSHDPSFLILCISSIDYVRDPRAIMIGDRRQVRETSALESLLQNLPFLEEIARFLNDAYNKDAGTNYALYPELREEQDKPAGLTVRDSAIATNIAGFLALETAIALLRRRPNRNKQKITAILLDIENGKVTEEEKVFLMHEANLAWKVSQAFRAKPGQGFGSRIRGNSNFVLWQSLTPQTQGKDWVQIQAAARKLRQAIGNVTNEEKDAAITAAFDKAAAVNVIVMFRRIAVLQTEIAAGRASKDAQAELDGRLLAVRDEISTLDHLILEADEKLTTHPFVPLQMERQQMMNDATYLRQAMLEMGEIIPDPIYSTAGQLIPRSIVGDLVMLIRSEIETARTQADSSEHLARLNVELESLLAVADRRISQLKNLTVGKEPEQRGVDRILAKKKESAAKEEFGMLERVLLGREADQRFYEEEVESVIQLASAKAVAAGKVLSKQDKADIREAGRLAIITHYGQNRKDGVTPFIVHPINVVKNLISKFDVWDPIALQIALLHDTREDQGERYKEMKQLIELRLARMGRPQRTANLIRLGIRLLTKLDDGQGGENEYFSRMLDPHSTFNKETRANGMGADRYSEYDDEFIRHIQLIKVSDRLANLGELKSLFIKGKPQTPTALGLPKKTFDKTFDSLIPALINDSRSLLTPEQKQIFLSEFAGILRSHAELRGKYNQSLKESAVNALTRLIASPAFKTSVILFAISFSVLFQDPRFLLGCIASIEYVSKDLPNPKAFASMEVYVKLANKALKAKHFSSAQELYRLVIDANLSKTVANEVEYNKLATIYHQIITKFGASHRTDGYTEPGRLNSLHHVLVQKLRDYKTKYRKKKLIIVVVGIGSKGAPTIQEFASDLKEAFGNAVKVFGVDREQSLVDSAIAALGVKGQSLPVEYRKGDFDLKRLNLESPDLIVEANTLMLHYTKTEKDANRQLASEALGPKGFFVHAAGSDYEKEGIYFEQYDRAGKLIEKSKTTKISGLNKVDASSEANALTWSRASARVTTLRWSRVSAEMTHLRWKLQPFVFALVLSLVSFASAQEPLRTEPISHVEMNERLLNQVLRTEPLGLNLTMHPQMKSEALAEMLVAKNLVKDSMALREAQSSNRHVFLLADEPTTDDELIAQRVTAITALWKLGLEQDNVLVVKKKYEANIKKALQSMRDYGLVVNATVIDDETLFDQKTRAKDPRTAGAGITVGPENLRPNDGSVYLLIGKLVPIKGLNVSRIVEAIKKFLVAA